MPVNLLAKTQLAAKDKLRYAICAGAALICVIASVSFLNRATRVVAEKKDSVILLQPSFSQSVPSPDTANLRLHPLFAKSQSVIQEKSVQDARRKARDIVACITQARLQAGAEALLERSAGENSPELKQLYDEKLERLQEKLTSNAAQDCALAGSKSLGEMVYPALLAAAETGDQDAASCYVLAKFELSPRQMQADEVDSYRTRARAFIEEGIARGDWRFVDLAANASGTFLHKYKDWFGQLMPQSDEMQYRYLRLEEFGADAEFGESIRGRLATLRDKLSVGAIERGDHWASVQFETHFAQGGRLSSIPQFCEMH